MGLNSSSNRPRALEDGAGPKLTDTDKALAKKAKFDFLQAMRSLF
jgi:hypothetical protein